MREDAPTMESVTYEPIGVVRSPFDDPEGMPIQPAGAADAKGVVELEETYAPALADLEGFSHCYVLYHFHAAEGSAPLSVEPFLDDRERGLFATRAPRRPNPIGLSVVAIETVRDAEVVVRGVDVVDGTPVLDVKPFVPAFDVPASTSGGWVAASSNSPASTRSDDRFV